MVKTFFLIIFCFFCLFNTNSFANNDVSMDEIASEIQQLKTAFQEMEKNYKAKSKQKHRQRERGRGTAARPTPTRGAKVREREGVRGTAGAGELWPRAGGTSRTHARTHKHTCVRTHTHSHTHAHSHA